MFTTKILYFLLLVPNKLQNFLSGETDSIYIRFKNRNAGNDARYYTVNNFTSDNDDNMTIEEHEVSGLINRIKGINGVEVNESLFRDAITKSGGSLQCVMDIIRNLMDDDIPKENEIFIIKG